ncbi:hypothetical protein KIN20_022467 [Parelaphostrongylus tenuis]|uniref:Uncharacterized protein n=1 Tax=Parelaphostrongylus tenuis TaxID=148309 RepID=A0AAD5MQ87_PARTN|nr:hypothetical protein KIN20_022467 [Parelaphostrongylus tenuis]
MAITTTIFAYHRERTTKDTSISCSACGIGSFSISDGAKSFGTFKSLQVSILIGATLHDQMQRVRVSL